MTEREELEFAARYATWRGCSAAGRTTVHGLFGLTCVQQHTAELSDESVRDQRDEYANKLDMLREALGVEFEPQSTPFKRMIEAAKKKVSNAKLPGGRGAD